MASSTPPDVPARAFTVRLTPQMDQLPAAVAFVQQALESLDLPRRALYEILTAADEAVTNVIKHAYGGSSEGEFSIYVWHSAERIILSIRHRGQPPDLRRVPPPDLTSDLEHRRPGGLGIYLMQKLMDEVHFVTYGDGTSETRLIKRVSGWSSAIADR